MEIKIQIELLYLFKQLKNYMMKRLSGNLSIGSHAKYKDVVRIVGLGLYYSVHSVHQIAFRLISSLMPKLLKEFILKVDQMHF